MSYTSIFFLSQSEKKLTVSKKVFLEIDYFNLEYRLLIFFFAFTQSKHIDYFFFKFERRHFFFNCMYTDLCALGSLDQL